MTLLAARGVAKRFGDREVLREVDVAIARGDRVGLVGPNGSGKTTLLRLLAGALEPDAGRFARARGLRTALLEQELLLPSDRTLREFVLEARERLDAVERGMRELEPRLDDPDALARYGDLAARFEHAGGYGFEALAARVLGGLGFAASDGDRPLATFSGGERTRAGLARLLLEDADVLLLDEPTNHLDLDALEWLERFLLEREGAFLVVSHDRYFLDRVTARTLAIEDGSVAPYRGGYTTYLRQRAAEDERRERSAARQAAEVARQEAFIERERSGQRARQARARAKQLARMERVAAPARARELRARLESRSVASPWVLQTTPLLVGRDAPLLRTPALEAERGARVAIVGPNGSGKTTLLRTLVGELSPLEGHVRAAPGVVAAVFAQSQQAALEPDRTVLDAFAAGRHWTEQESRDMLARFLFRGEQVFRTVGTLSGGEGARLALARLASSSANLLLLDEPTNHLDLPSREALEDALASFQGTLLVVSHDRYLIDRLATHVWLVEAGAIRIFEGTYSDMQRRRAAEAAGPAEPRRPVPPGPAIEERRHVRRDRRAAGRQQARMDELERRITDVEARLEALAPRVEEVAQSGNYLESRRAGAEYAELERALRDLYAEWASAGDQA